MIRKLQIKFTIIIMSIVTVMLTIILSTVVLATDNSLRAESIQILLSIPNISNNSFIPYLSVKVDKQSSYMIVEGKFYENANIDFVELITTVKNSKNEIGDLPKYNLRYLKQDSGLYDIYNFIDITNEKMAMQSLMRNCLRAGIISFIAFTILTIIMVKTITSPVEKAWKQQKQFIGDASHELKTPLTVILTNAELLEDAVNNKEDKTEDILKDSKQYISNIHTMSLQMRSLVEQLLDLARTDNGNMKSTFEKFSLSELTDTEVMIFEPSFFDKDLVLQSDIAPDISVYGNSERIKQVIDIFLDNAIKYTKDNGNVYVSLKTISNNRCQLCVKSEGTPLDKKEIGNIFKRFYRADKARSNNGSYGLGLSIAKNIIDEHDGRIYAKPLKDGNAFIIELRKKRTDSV